MGWEVINIIYESAESHGVFINRFPCLDNGRHGTYHEIGCDPDKEGIRIASPDFSGEKNVRNAMLYPIDKLLLFDEQTVGENGTFFYAAAVGKGWGVYFGDDVYAWQLYDITFASAGLHRILSQGSI